MSHVVKQSSRSVLGLKGGDLGISDSVFRVLIHASPRPLLITDEGAQIIYVNPAWEHITGYSFAEVRGKNPNIMKSGKTPQHVYDALWDHLNNDKPFTTDEIVDRKKNGHLFNLRSIIFPITIGSTRYFIQSFDDVTAAKHIEEYRSNFLKTAAHDLRGPLTSLAIMSELLALHTPECSQEATEMHKEVIRLKELATTLLDLRMFEKGKMSISCAPFDMNALIKEVTSAAEVRDQKAVIKIDESLDRFVVADKVRIREVLSNLLDNAMRHARAGTSIEISAKKKDGRALISITNQGSYIPQAQRIGIFKAFYKLTDSSKGHGLGLYIASEIIKAHRGKIWVVSAGGGKKSHTTFHFTLPLATS